MELTLATPALLFPTISLLLLAYTNRFLALAALIRSLHAQYQAQQNKILVGQIHNLRVRVLMIRYMQSLGIASLFLCVLCMLFLFTGYDWAAKAVFIASLVLLMGSLAFSLTEIQISLKALNLQLSDLDAA